jgi:flavin reductase (DIM6/NTAB) family NADH-FMN oxidoreductase RutF
VQFGAEPQHTAKIAFPADKAEWHPSVLPGPIVLVSTVDARGEPNIAPKSWISMMAFRGPVLAFGCHRSHATARYAEEAGEFVVNFPPEALVERIWAMPASHGMERIARSGLTLLPAREVAPPLIRECKAHLECTLKAVTRLGEEVVVFGKIVAASIDEDCVESSVADQYFRLRPVFFLEEGVYGSIDTAKRIGAAWPTKQSLTVVELYDPPGDQDMEAHVAYLRSLRNSGVLLMAGSYDGWREEPDRSRPMGLMVLAVPEDKAREIAETDPLVRGGARYITRRWNRTF